MTVAEPSLSPARKGWQGRIDLRFGVRGQRTVLEQRRRQGPLTVQRPFYPEGDTCHVYLLHPPGAAVAGDQLETNIAVGTSAHAVLTSPGATQFYRSSGRQVLQQQNLVVEPEASLEWLPQENILFSGAEVRSTTRVELSSGARFVGWEMLCMGRPSSHETFQTGHFDQRFEIHVDGHPLLLDRLQVSPRPSGKAGMAGHAVAGTLVATPADQKALDRVRDIDPGTLEGIVGSTLLDHALVVRYLGAETEELKGLFARIWEVLRPLVLERPACPPRIWKT